MPHWRRSSRPWHRAEGRLADPECSRALPRRERNVIAFYSRDHPDHASCTSSVLNQCAMGLSRLIV